MTIHYRPSEYFKEEDSRLLKSTNYYDYNVVYEERNNLQGIFMKA